MEIKSIIHHKPLVDHTGSWRLMRNITNEVRLVTCPHLPDIL